ncbi:hypothetical protein [Paenibacillus wulumuqiensis]|nr:hypothetical protein [Paenibacillus wulumuqiensis]
MDKEIPVFFLGSICQMIRCHDNAVKRLAILDRQTTQITLV